VFTVAFIICISSAGMFIHDEALDYYESQNAEDAEFTVYNDIDDDIEEIENKFNVNIEKVTYTDVSTDNYDLRLFNQSKNINRYVIQEGKDLTDENSILINRFIADAHNISIGDSIEIKGHTFTVNGFFVRPDYTYMLKNLDDSFASTDKFGIALLTDAGLEMFDDHISYYSVVYNNDNNIREFRDYINENYITTSYLDSDNNSRIGYVVTEGKAISLMARNFSPVLFVLIIAIIVVLLSRIVRKDIRTIGIFSSLGYRKREIINYYSSYGVFAGLFGSVIGVLVGMALTEPVINFYCGDVAFPEMNVRYYVPGIVIALIVPIIVFTVTSRLTVNSFLKNNVIQLLDNTIDSHKKKRNGYTGDRLSFINKFRIRLILQNISRSLTFVLGIFICSLLLVTSFYMKSSVNYLVNERMEEQIKYENVYYLNEPQTETLAENAEKFCFKSLEIDDSGESIKVMGIVLDSEYYNLKDNDGNTLNINNGNYITLAYSKQTGLKAGDIVKCYNSITLEDYEFEIDGVADITIESALFINIDKFNEIFGREDGTYDGLMSSEKIDIDDSYIYSSQDKSEIINNIKTHIEVLEAIEYILIIMGVILTIVIVYTLSNMLIDENNENIIMFKVLGYRKGEISRIVLNVNIILLIIGFVLGMFAANAFCTMMYESEVETVGIYVETKASVLEIVPAFIIMFLSYIVSIFLLRKKVDNVDITSSLKEL
jgi:putative ABC transport system permease protein